MPVPALTITADQAAPGRATADLADAMTLAGTPDVTEIGKQEKRRNIAKRCSTGEVFLTRQLAEKGKKGTGRGVVNSVGGAAAMSMLAGAATGARGLQLAMIKEAFSRLDLDEDGYISAADLGSAFRSMGRDASDRRRVGYTGAVLYRCRPSKVNGTVGSPGVLNVPLTND